MQAVLLVLSLAFTSHALESESMSSLVAKLQAERQRKAVLIDHQKAKDMLEMAKQEEYEDEQTFVPVIAREVEESENYLNTAIEAVEDQISAAKHKMHNAKALEMKAKNMDTSIEGVTSEQEKAKLAKLTFESSFLEKEAHKNSMRERDTSFVALEAGKLSAEKREMQAALQKKAELRVQEKLGLEATAAVMMQEAQKELKTAQGQHSAVEAVAQANEGVFLTGRPKHMAPKWMIEAQISEAKESSSEKNAKEELKMQKSYLWNKMGKKYTCAAEHNQVKAIIMDDNKHAADCLEKQLDKYCLETLRAPAMEQAKVHSLIQKPDDCLVNGVDKRVPKSVKDRVASHWCSVIQVLQGISAQPLNEKYFLLLEDDIKVDPVNFEETIKSFADTYPHNWDLVQLDPHGKHNDTDKLESWNGHEVYRNSKHGQYFGTSAILMKTLSAPRILEKMMNMHAVPLDTLASLFNGKDAVSAASLKAGIVSAPKKLTLLQKDKLKCGVTQSGLAQLEAIEAKGEQSAQPMSLIQTQAAPLDFFAFEAKLGEQKANKNWQNQDLTA